MGEETKKTTNQQPIEPRDAVQAAVDYFINVVGPVDGNTRLAVEELEMNKEGTLWLVTLSHRDPTAPAVYTLYPGSDAKLYKVFQVDAFTKRVVSMKAKKL